MNYYDSSQNHKKKKVILVNQLNSQIKACENANFMENTWISQMNINRSNEQNDIFYKGIKRNNSYANLNPDYDINRTSSFFPSFKHDYYY